MTTLASFEPLFARLRRAGRLGGLPEPCSAGEIEEAERQLGFSLPRVVRGLYAEVGNGGFVPEARPLIGKPWRGTSPSVVELYVELTNEGQWHQGLLDMFDQGCGSSFCVDCNDPSLRVLYASITEGAETRRDGSVRPVALAPIDEGSYVTDFFLEADELSFWLDAVMRGAAGVPKLRGGPY
jgi:hypothetical protein